MSSITNLFFLKNLINKDVDCVKVKSPIKNSPKTGLPTPLTLPPLPTLLPSPSLPPSPSLARTKSKNKSVENFLKYQWSWTL